MIKGAAMISKEAKKEALCAVGCVLITQAIALFFVYQLMNQGA